jgi:cyclic pyranopterin phosphate synthase|tara:strand:- start:97074 stop:97553 length:480 start_codon:yes stop_codon:yes gene_type:complete
MMPKLSHFNDQGQAHMVDVSNKDITSRIAMAKGRIIMKAETLAIIMDGSAKKGDVLGIARLAGIMAAKKTSELIPLCHPLPISKITIDIEPITSENSIEIQSTVKTTGQTGVEMEALTAVSITALTVYDMVKAVDKTMKITDIRVILKDGGKSGLLIAK